MVFDQQPPAQVGTEAGENVVVGWSSAKRGGQCIAEGLAAGELEVADREDLVLVGRVDVEKLLGASDFQEKAFIQLRQTAVGARSGSSCGVKVAEIRAPVLLSRNSSWRGRTLSAVRKFASMPAAVTATLWFKRLDHESNVVRRVWIIKAGEPGDEVQMDRAGGPVALLGDNDL